MKKIFIAFSILILPIISCQESNESLEIKTLEINPADTAKNGFSDYFEMEKYIVLETSDSSLMQDIRKIYIANTKIFILTWGSSQVLVFDENGQFINKIGKYGRGPNEYSYLVDFSVSPNGDTICLYDKGLQKTFYYSSQDSLLFTQEINADLETFLKLPGGDLIGYSYLNYMDPLNDTIYQLWHFNQNGKVVGGCLPVRKDILGNSMGLASSFNVTTTGNYFIPYTQNIIYKISENPFKINPVYKIDFKDRSMPANILDLPRKEMNQAFRKAFILSGEFIGKTNLLLNIYSIELKKSLVAIYNIKKGNYILLNSENLWDDKNELPIKVNMQNTFLGVDKLITISDPLDLSNHDYNNHQSTGAILKQKIKETDNPILVIYKEK